MKNLYILWIAMAVVASSCQRSQFSATTRQYKNGKVTYVNNHQKERSKTSKSKFHESHLKTTDAQNITTAVARKEMQNLPELEITKINAVPIQDYENLIASTSNVPTIITMNENRELVNANSIPDTIKGNVPNKGAIMDNSIEQIIKFKSGNVESVKIISQSYDMLYYKSILEPEIERGIKIERIDTIYQIQHYEPIKGKVVDTRKNEPHSVIGFISSLLGLVPVFGLPFAILAMILGHIGLKRIRANPLRYKGTKFAKAGKTIGIIGVILFGIVLILAVSGFFKSCT